MEIQDSEKLWNILELSNKTGHVILPNSNSDLEESINSTFSSL